MIVFESAANHLNIPFFALQVCQIFTGFVLFSIDGHFRHGHQQCGIENHPVILGAYSLIVYYTVDAEHTDAFCLISAFS